MSSSGQNDWSIGLPTKKTLDKYGLTLDDWTRILIRQGFVCPICKQNPKTGRWVIDHEHVKDWKKLPPQERKKFVRGLLCWIDNNRILTRGVTITKLENAVIYLKEYESSKALK